MEWSKVEQFIEKQTPALLTVLLVYALVRSLLAATAKIYWYDELLTWLVASQKDWHGMVSAIWAPVDSQHPLFYLIEQSFLRLIPDADLALRVPSAAAFVITLLCVSTYVRRSGGQMVAFLCSTALLLSVIFRYYAEEARPYSLVVACVAFALICYQRSSSFKWVLL